MNERIEQLAGQVCDTLYDGDWNIPDEFIEKFAELIVRECAEIADESTSRPYESYGEKIRKHFGVE